MMQPKEGERPKEKAGGYFKELQSTYRSDASSIKRTYRKLASKLHPDKNADDPDATTKFQRVTRAYQVVSDDESRAAYLRAIRIRTLLHANTQNGHEKEHKTEPFLAFHVHVRSRERSKRSRGERLLYLDFIREKLELFVKDQLVLTATLREGSESKVTDVTLIESDIHRGFGIAFTLSATHSDSSTAASTTTTATDGGKDRLVLYTLTNGDRKFLFRIFSAYADTSPTAATVENVLKLILDDADLPPASVKKGFVTKRGTSGKFVSRYLLLGTESLIVARDETARSIVNIVPLRSELEYCQTDKVITINILPTRVAKGRKSTDVSKDRRRFAFKLETTAAADEWYAAFAAVAERIQQQKLAQSSSPVFGNGAHASTSTSKSSCAGASTSRSESNRTHAGTPSGTPSRGGLNNKSFFNVDGKPSTSAASARTTPATQPTSSTSRGGDGVYANGEGVVRRRSVLNSVKTDIVSKYEERMRNQETGVDSDVLWESNPFCVPEELDDLVFEADDYKGHGAKESDVITAKANVCLKEIALLTELAEVRRQKKVLMKALGESVENTPQSSQVLGTTKRHVEMTSNGATGTAPGGEGASKTTRSGSIFESLMSIIMVDTKTKDADAFDTGSTGARRKPSATVVVEKLV